MCYVVASHGEVEPGALRRARPPARLGDPHRRRARAAHAASRPSPTSPSPSRARGVELAAAAPLPSTDREVVVVTDPHYNTLVSHEIVGHPGRARPRAQDGDGLRGPLVAPPRPRRHQVGRPIASPLVTAYSDPALPGYGHYAYDHEGTPARRVVHIDRGVFRGFMNSRQTAAIFGGEPNGHCKATDASLVPLIRMSNTVFAAGADDPRRDHREVDHGYYLVGHRIPSIAESRENFRISARKVYEIRNGRARPALPRRRHHGRHARLPDERRRGRHRLPPLSRSRTAARDSPCRRSSSATAAPPCAAAPGSPAEADDLSRDHTRS